MPKKEMISATNNMLGEFQEDSGLPKGIHTEQQLWDEIFKKEIHEASFLLMPLIREIFGEEYSKETPVTPVATEFSVERPDTKEISSIRSDTTMKVGPSEIFHFECEISTDPDMGRRTYNYDSSIAFAYPERQKRKPVLLRYPHSAVLYLSQGIRAGSKPMDTLVCRLYFPPGKLVQTELLHHFPSDIIAENRKQEVEKILGKLSYVDYLIPAVKVQAYTLNEIQEKRLLILIPFMPIRFRPLLRRMEKEKEPIMQKSKLTNFYQDIIVVLEEAVTDGYISEKDRKCILSLLRKAMIRVFFKSSFLQEVIRMTAPILELEWETVERLQKENAKITAEKEAITAEKDAITAEKDAIIAEKDAEIRRLRERRRRLFYRRRKEG